MIFDPSSASHLKPWLVRTLEPICDAEPGALADYILALLKHNVPEAEMRQELAVQLDEFLEKECSSFIDTLFTVLRTKSYLPYSAHSPASPSFSKSIDTGIPIPLDGLLSPSTSSPHEQNRKRSIENDERDGRPAKGPRLGTEAQFPRYTNGHAGRTENRSTAGWSGRAERPPSSGYREGADMYGGVVGMPGMNSPLQMSGRRPQVYLPPDQKRGICRDYHNNGYCARGAMCKYSHGDDAVVPGQLYPMGPGITGMPGGLPFMPIFPGGIPFGVGGPGAAYDPHEARMDMRPTGRPHHRAPLLPRIQQEDGSQVVPSTRASGELPVIQDLTPTIPPDSDKSQTQTLQSHLPSLQQQSNAHPETAERIEYGGEQNGVGEPSYVDTPMDVEMSHPTEMRPPKGHSHSHGLRPPVRGGGRSRGTFGGEIHHFRPERRNDKTLVVEKIPEDKLTLEQVNEWFKRFGTVTNVAIDPSNAKALISFSNHEEAHTAWKSEDAVFNNRFVKVFWHRPMEGHGQVGARMLAASAPLVANMSAKDSSARPAPPPTSGSSASERKPSTTAAATASALAAKQQLLEQQIAEQKSLMASLSTASPDEKKTIMARLRKLGEEMNPIVGTTQASSSSTPVKKLGSSSLKVEDREKKERERLDKELEMHSATAAVDGEESTEDLKAKLERLKAEAASLGISEPEPSFGNSYRSQRGRGRGGRGFHRAIRGAPSRGSMKLDNRPKKLLVKGVRRENVQALRDWFETAGQLDSVETGESGDIIVSFKSRAAAEQGLSKGSNVPTIGTVSISWYSGPQATVGPGSTSVSAGTVSSTPSDVHSAEPARPSSPEQPTIHPSLNQEEEVIASGWGGDGDGEDGMGML